MKASAFLALFVIGSASFAQAKSCPTLVREPKRLICQTKMSYYGLPSAQKLVIDLKPTGNYEEWSGQLEFFYPGVQNENNAPNTLKAEVSIDTHGNSPCQQWNEYSLDINVLGYKVGGIGKSTSLTLKDGLDAVALDLKMNCSLQ